MSSSDRNPAGRHFLRVFAAAAVGALGLVLLLAWLTDPTGLLRGAGLAPALCAPGFASTDDRYVKPLVAASYGASEVLVGSSRVEYGFGRDAFSGRDVANLGFAGANLDGIGGMLSHAAERRMVRRVWIGLDFGTFIQPDNWQQSPRPPRSPRGRAAFALRHGLIDRRVAADALRTLVHPSACRQRMRGPDGFRTRRDSSFAPAAVTPEARRYLTDQWRVPRTVQAQLLAWNLLRFERLLADLRTRRIEVVLFFNPSSPPYREMVEEAGLEPFRGWWKRRIGAAASRRGALLVQSDRADFLRAIAMPPCPSENREMCLFTDLTHYRPIVGDSIAAAAERGRR